MHPTCLYRVTGTVLPSSDKVYEATTVANGMQQSHKVRSYKRYALPFCSAEVVLVSQLPRCEEAQAALAGIAQVEGIKPPQPRRPAELPAGSPLSHPSEPS